MSSNQKQAPALAPQQQRYPNAQGPTYLQRPPTPHRTEGFHSSTPPTYVQQAPPLNQPPNQGQPGLRGMAPTGPPTQASTPPQTAEMKVQQIPQQQQAMPPLTFVQQPVRGGQPNFYTRQPPPQNQNAPRMTNPHRGQMQHVYQPQSVPMYPNMSQVFISNQLPFTYNGTPRQNYLLPFQPMAGQPLCPTFPTQQATPQTAYYYQPQQMPMQTRLGPPQPVTPAPPNPAQAPPQAALPINPPQQQQQPVKRRRANALTIIDPNTGKDKSKEIYEGEGEMSPPQSGESSARQTPQPTSGNINANSKEVQAAFAAQVAQAIGSDDGSVMGNIMDIHEAPPNLHQNQMHIEPYHTASQQQQPPQQPIRDGKELAQSSKLQVPIREFVPQSVSAANNTSLKETPVVSAITDAVEVTITNKIPKDRESPVKGRKSRETVTQQSQQQQILPPREPQYGRGEHMTGGAKEFVPRESQLREQFPPKELPKEPKEEIPIQKESSVVKEISPSGQPVQARDSIEGKGGKGYKGKQQQHGPAVADNKVPVSELQKMSISGGASTINPPPSVAVTMTATPSSLGLEKSPESVPPSAAPVNVPESTSASAQSGRKSSNTSQKTKDSSNKQSSGQPVQQGPTAPAASGAAKPTPAPVVPVPVSQPAKPTNKTSKMRDLNMKGANKEGTDMDAFATTDNVTTVPAASVVENSVPSVPAPVAPETKPAPQPIAAAPEETIPPVVAKPMETKTLPKHKVDVTSIVKEVPKPLNLPPAQPPVETQDETDRALSANEKLVQAKNEANSKANAVDNNGDGGVIERQKLPYREDQWSPFNKEGKKVYDREFLFLLQNDPKSKKKPDNLPNLDVVLKDSSNRRDGADMRYRSTQNDFSPMYVKSQSQRGPIQKRNSQQGKIANKGGKPNVIHVSLSLREDIKLRETENAWKPARLGNSTTRTDDEKKTDELYKKVRGVLNKLTPQKFETLVDQVRSLQIDNTDRLQGVIDLVFEKAVDEPNFSVAYALMCRELALMQVPADRKKDGSSGPEFVNFRKLLVTRCQIEFEKNSVDETKRNVKIEEIEKLDDVEKKKEMLALLDEEDRRLRMKSVGNIRFIGELFKQQMLTSSIMLRCLTNLLQDKDEESLECLCKLLSTIGKDMEINKKMNLEPFFQTMKEIVDKKHGKISSRVRFMLQDVIDLRNSKWVPRRQDLNPKTMDQIQKEASEEQLNIQVMNSMPMNTPRKDDRGGAGPNSDRKRRNVSDDGWSSVTPRNRAQYSVESSKLKNKPPPMDEIQLGSSTLFGRWGSGSNIKNPVIPPTNTNNMYAALAENSDIDKRPMGGSGSRSGNKEPYSSKGPSMERYKSYEDGRGSRNSSQHRSRDSSVNSQRSGHMGSGQQQPQLQREQQAPPQQTQQPQSLPPSMPAKTTAPAPVAPPADIPPELLDRRINNILEEYLNDCCKVVECELEIKSGVPANCHDQLVSQWFNNVLERSSTGRQKTGELLVQLVKLGTISLENYTNGLIEILGVAEDLTIDIPKIWDYLAELIVPALSEDVIPMQRLKQSFDCLISAGYAPKLLNLLIKLLIKMKGPNFVQENWQKSGLQLSEFFKSQTSADDVNNFVKENQLEFLVMGGNAPAGNSQLTNEQIREKLLLFFKADTSYDDITNWINANLGDRVQDIGFIRALMTAICEDSIVGSKLKPDLLKKHYSLLRRYVDSNETLELHCLYALQALINKLEHPSGILLLIFDRLWDDSVFSYDSFIAWESSKDSAELEGKGVALKQLTSFFTALKENEDESSTSTSEEA